MSWGSNGCWPGGEEEADAPHAAGATDPGTAGEEDAVAGHTPMYPGPPPPGMMPMGQGGLPPGSSQSSNLLPYTMPRGPMNM